MLKSFIKPSSSNKINLLFFTYDSYSFLCSKETSTVPPRKQVDNCLHLLRDYKINDMKIKNKQEKNPQRQMFDHKQCMADLTTVYIFYQQINHSL